MFRIDPVVLFGKALGMIAQQAEPDDPLMRELLHWAGKLEAAAGERWRGVVASGIRCTVPDLKMGIVMPCDESAIAACAACRQPTCLRHSMVAINADIVCLRCVNEVVSVVRERLRQGSGQAGHGSNGAQRQPDPGEEFERLRKAHLRTLGLKDPTDWSEIETSYKDLLVKNHPDRAPPAKRKQAEEKFKKVRVAYDWLAANKSRKVA